MIRPLMLDAAVSLLDVAKGGIGLDNSIESTFRARRNGATLVRSKGSGFRAEPITRECNEGRYNTQGRREPSLGLDLNALGGLLKS